jgi:uncharacterized protein YjdB
MTVNSMSSITGPGSVCAGQTITLSCAGTGGTWSSADIAVATVGSASGVVSGLTAGTSLVSYTLGTGCVATALVTVNNFSAISGPSTMCVGQTATLSVTTTGGAWTSSNPTIATVNSSGIVSGIRSGLVNIHYSLGTCVAVQSVRVNTLSAITGPTQVCQGQSVSLTQVGAGIWSSSDPSVAIIGSSSGYVTGVSAGTTTITFTVLSGCAATRVMTVNPLSPTTGPSSVCMTQSITLANATSGGVWTSGNPTIATISSTSGLATGILSGVLTISYTIPATGCRFISSLVVNRMSPITGSGTVCEGQTITLSNPVLGGTWLSVAPAVASVNTTSGVVTGVASGGTVITYTTPAGCINSTSVNVNPLAAISGLANVCLGGTVLLTNATTGGVWSSSNNTVATAGSASGVVAGIRAGGVSIYYTVTATGCRATLPFVVNNCRIADDNEALTGGGDMPTSIVLIPNPNKGAFTIKGNLETMQNEDVQIDIVDMLGHIVHRATYTAIDGKLNERIELSTNLANGMYLLNLTSGKGNAVIHFVIEQ